jgi:hypothetical protein
MLAGHDKLVTALEEEDPNPSNLGSQIAGRGFFANHFPRSILTALE